MSRNRRLLVAALTAIALFAAVVLAAGLSALPVEERTAGIPRRQAPTGTPEAGAPESTMEMHPETMTERSLVPMILIAIALIALIIFLLVTAEGRKLLVYTLLTLLLLLFVLLLREQPASAPQSTVTPAQESAATPAPVPPPLVFEPPPWLVLGASLGLALLLVGAIALAGLRLARRQRASFSPSPLPELAEQARQALADLRAGQDLRGTIIRCYREMGETLQQHRGFRRSPAMTPEEFARGLALTNLPQAEIWRITRLFERVRYGQHEPAPEEETEAIVCLTTIVQACEEK